MRSLNLSEARLLEPDRSTSDSTLACLRVENTPTRLLPLALLAGLWPPRPATFPDLMTPVEAAQYLRLDELGMHNPVSAVRTLNYFRDHGQLKATKYARHVWYRKAELDRLLAVKTET